MRIACLQFSPKVGDLENNLNRADAVLSKADVEELDLMVLPELAFTGKSHHGIAMNMAGCPSFVQPRVPDCMRCTHLNLCAVCRRRTGWGLSSVAESLAPASSNAPVSLA